jgi:hypothetical protein
MTRYSTKTRFLRHEIKVVLDPVRVDQTVKFAQERLKLDRFSTSAEGYDLTTLYLDTEGYRVHFKLLDGTGTKYRIRRYGNEEMVYLERKTRKGTLVRKRREAAPVSELERILQGQYGEESWSGTFCRTIRDFGLKPTLLLTYRRRAWQGPFGSRLTLDHSIEAWRGPNIGALEPTGESVPVTAGTVLELKYDLDMPPVFKDLMQELALNSAAFSKYGTGLTVFGMVARPTNANVPTP